MQEAIIQKRLILPNIKFGTGAVPDRYDERDYKYDDIALGAAPVDWEKGFDIEKELKFTLRFKNQNSSNSCVGQAWSYYTGILNLLEVGSYHEISAKAYYSQIYLPGGGAYLREGGKLTVDWGALPELVVPSYKNGGLPDEAYMVDKAWKSSELDRLATVLKAKEYRTISAAKNMELFAQAIRDNFGVVGGVYGSNNGTWGTNEPKPPKSGESLWGHALFYGKFGIDAIGKYIATPNSWGIRNLKDALHPDDWQKFREDYFATGNMFNPWTLTDQMNAAMPISDETKKILATNEKKFVIEGEGPGRKGIIVNGKVKLVKKEREAVAATYVVTNNGMGITVPTKMFDEMPKDGDF